MDKVVLTLLKDEKRRCALMLNFKVTYSQFNFFYGFNKEYAETYKKNNIVKKSMTASEISCSLGHLNILDDFLTSSKDYIFILEDDILGEDSDFNRINKVLSSLNGDFILFVGGLNGLNCRKYLYGEIIDADKKIFKIPAIYHCYIARTCCYIVTKKIASKISRKQHEFLDLADNWGRLLDAKDRVYFCDILKHPIDLSDSNIEKDRLKLKGKNIFSRIIKSGVLASGFLFLRKFLTKILAIFLGYKKI